MTSSDEAERRAVALTYSSSNHDVEHRSCLIPTMDPLSLTHRRYFAYDRSKLLLGDKLQTR